MTTTEFPSDDATPEELARLIFQDQDDDNPNALSPEHIAANASEARSTSLGVETLATFQMVNMRTRQVQSLPQLPPVAVSPELSAALTEMHKRDQAASAAESDARAAAGAVEAAQTADQAAALAAAERDEPAPPATHWPLAQVAFDLARGCDARYKLAADAASKVSRLAADEPMRATLDAAMAEVERTRRQVQQLGAIGANLPSFGMYMQSRHLTSPAHRHSGAVRAHADTVANAFTAAAATALERLDRLQAELVDIGSQYDASLPTIGYAVYGGTESAEYAGVVRLTDGSTFGPYPVREPVEAVAKAVEESGRPLRFGQQVEDATGAGVWAEFFGGNRMDCYSVKSDA